MGGARRSAAVAGVGALLLTVGAPEGRAQPPVEISGELEASVVSRNLPSDDGHELRTEVLAYTHAATFLWQPWIATVSLDLNAAFEASSRSEFGEATAFSGDLLLSVLPASRYPFEIFFSASDNRFDGDFSGLDYRRLRTGVSGRAALGDRTSLDYLFSYNEFDRDRYGLLTAQRAEATLRRSFSPGELPLNITDIGVAFNYYTTDFDSQWSGGQDYSTEFLAGTVFYRAAPTERVDQDFSASFISDSGGSGQDRYNRILGQGVGTLQWHSPSNDVAATSAVRMLFQQVDHGFGLSKRDTESALLAANAGVNWRASDRLSMSLGARATAEQIGTFGVTEVDPLFESSSSNYTAGLLGTVDYRSLSQEVAGFNWHWDARAVGDVGYDSNRYKVKHFETLYGPHSDAQFIIGHTFERSMRMPWLQAVDVSLLQEAGFSHYSEDEVFEPIITHSASFSKGFAGESSSTYFRLYFRDTHGFGSRPRDYQTDQIDFTRQVQLAGNQSLHGSLGAQIVRQMYDHRDDFYIFSRADLTYEYRDLFGIDGLSFSSDIRINSIGLDNLARDWRDDLTPDLFRNDWRNRLQYRIGQMALSLEGALFHDDGKIGHYVRFAGRRTFDYAD